MVRSTTIFRVSDALPLAASVDDESVSLQSLVQDGAHLTDGKGFNRVQTAIQARLPSLEC
jgi:hypothetical protein